MTEKPQKKPKLKARRVMLSNAVSLRTLMLKLDAGSKVTVLPESSTHALLRNILTQVDGDLRWVLKQSKRAGTKKEGTAESKAKYKRTSIYRRRIEDIALMERYMELYPEPYRVGSETNYATTKEKPGGNGRTDR